MGAIGTVTQGAGSTIHRKADKSSGCRSLPGRKRRPIRTYSLHELGWRTAVVWECSMSKDKAVGIVGDLLDWLHGTDLHFESAL